MIQRIQSVYLLFAFIFVGLLFFFPFTSFISGGTFQLLLQGLTSSNQGIGSDIQQPYWLTGLGSIISILILVTIFLYKNRKLQMYLCLIVIVLLLALNGSMYLLSQKYKLFLNAEIHYKLTFIFPVVSAILVFLAYFSIKKDERLVRSLDRLR